jgi:hypothetical protein
MTNGISQTVVEYTSSLLGVSALIVIIAWGLPQAFEMLYDQLFIDIQSFFAIHSTEF